MTVPAWRRMRRAVDHPGPRRLARRARADSARLSRPRPARRSGRARPARRPAARVRCLPVDCGRGRRNPRSGPASISAPSASASASASIAQPRSAGSSSMSPTTPAQRAAFAVDSRRRASTRSGLAHRPEAPHRARPGVAARAVSHPRRHPLLAVDWHCPTDRRIADSRASRSLPTNARRSCHGVGLAKLVGVGRVIDRRIKVDQRLDDNTPSAAAIRADGQALRRARTSAPAPARRASAGSAALISRSGGIIPVAVARPKRQLFS